jgi:hypothetical protein
MPLTLHADPWQTAVAILNIQFRALLLNQSQAITCITEVIIQQKLTHKILLMAILHAA